METLVNWFLKYAQGGVGSNTAMKGPANDIQA